VGTHPGTAIPTTLDPAKVTADLVNAIGEGINHALALIGSPARLRTPAPVTTTPATSNQQTIGTTQLTSNRQGSDMGHVTSNQQRRTNQWTSRAAWRHLPGDIGQAAWPHRPGDNSADAVGRHNGSHTLIGRIVTGRFVVAGSTSKGRSSGGGPRAKASAKPSRC
jgi:hypothetical protein